MFRYYVNKVIGLLLLDISLPGMSGIEGLSKIREKDKELLILMLTMHNEA